MAETTDIQERRLQRERKARKDAEQLLEAKSRQLFEANEALLKMNEQLEATIEERTHELELMARFSMENPDPRARISFDGDVMLQNEAAASIEEFQFDGNRYSRKAFWKTLAELAGSNPSGFTAEATADHRHYSFICQKVDWVGYINIYGRDITELREKEAENKRLSLIARETINGVVVTNATGEVEWVNAAFERITGFTLQEIKGKRPGAVLQGPASNQETVSYLRNQIHAGSPFSCEIVNYDKSGSPYWVRINGQPIRNEAGDIVQYFALEEDITRQREADERVREADAKLQFALEKIGDNSWEHDFRTGISTFSRRDKDLLGYEEAEGQPTSDYWWRSVHPEDKQILIDNDKAYRDGLKDFHTAEYRLLAKDGSIKWVLDRGIVVEKSPDGKPLRIVGTHIDITVLKNTEEALKRSNLRWQFALEGAGDGVWEYNLHTGEVFYSISYKRMLGYEDSEFPNDPQAWRARIHPDDMAQVMEIDMLYENRTIRQHNRAYRLLHRNGQYLWIMDRGMISEYADDGSPLRIIGTHTNIDEAKQLQLELSSTASRLSSLIANLQAGVLVENENREIVLTNQRFCDLFGISANPESLAGFDYRLLQFQSKKLFADPEAFEVGSEAVLETKKHQLAERLALADGRVFSRDYIPIHNDLNQYVGHMWVYSDITDQENSAKALDAQRVFYENVLNNLPADIVVFDINHRYQFLNPKSIRDDELRKWIIGKDDFEYFAYRNRPLKAAEDRRRQFNLAVASKQLMSWEEDIVKENGETVSWLRNLFPVVNPAGDVVQVIGYGLDITERRAFEHRIQQSEKKYRDLINSNQGLIITHDLQGLITSVNPAVTKTLGYNEDDLLGKSLANFLTVDNKELFESQYLPTLKSEKQLEGVFRILNKDGQSYYLLFRNILFEEEGSASIVISFSQDITKRIKAEKELELAKEATEAAAEAKERFLANMSHEIRTPMNGIIGIASLLGKTGLAQQQQEYVNMITASADSLLVIVNDILDLEKIISGKVQLETIPFSLPDKVKTTVDTFRYQAEQKALTLTFHNRLPEQFWVSGDPYRLTQILNNLLGNAIKFTDAGAVDVHVAIAAQTDASATISFEVCDEGIGIDHAKINDIFDPYVQAQADVARKYGGTGLGLSITKNLVELQGGQMMVESKPGKGSSFLFVLTYQLADKPLESFENVPIDIGWLKHKRILVAEDVAINQFLIRHLLEGWGVACKLVENGVEALEAAATEDWDAILMDIQMPVMNGMDASRAIRALSHERRKRVPIVALTANALYGDEAKYREAGMDGYLSKPFREQGVYQALYQVLYTDSPSTPLPEAPQKAAQETVSESSKTENLLVKGTSIDEKPSQLFSTTMLREMSGGNATFVPMMLQLFVQTAPEYIAQMQSASSLGDWQQVGDIAHKLKPTIDSLEVTSLREVVRKVEHLGRHQPEAEELPKMLQVLCTVLNDVIEQVRLSPETTHS